MAVKIVRKLPDHVGFKVLPRSLGRREVFAWIGAISIGGA